LPRAPPSIQPSRLHSATRTPTPGFANPGSADTRSRSDSTRHRRAATQLTSALERRMRQPPAPSSPSRVFETERLARAPLRQHSAPSVPLASVTPEGRRPLDLEDAHVEPLTTPAPHEARCRPRPSRSAALSPVAGWTEARLTFASRASMTCPSRGAGRWWALLLPGGPTLLGFRSSSKCLRGASSVAALGLCALRTEALQAFHLGRDAPSPGRQRPLFAPFPHSPEPVELSPAGVSQSSLRFGYRARNRSARRTGLTRHRSRK